MRRTTAQTQNAVNPGVALAQAESECLWTKPKGSFVSISKYTSAGCTITAKVCFHQLFKTKDSGVTPGRASFGTPQTMGARTNKVGVPVLPL